MKKGLVLSSGCIDDLVFVRECHLDAFYYPIMRTKEVWRGGVMPADDKDNEEVEIVRDYELNEITNYGGNKTPIKVYLKPDFINAFEDEFLEKDVIKTFKTWKACWKWVDGIIERNEWSSRYNHDGERINELGQRIDDEGELIENEEDGSV